MRAAPVRKKSGRHLVAAALLAGGLALAPPVFAQAPDVGVREVVEAQLDAFRAGDVERAYSYAAPSIQRRFPLEAFDAMVARGYEPVYRSKSATFGRMVDQGSLAAQEVFLTGPDGTDWVALYTLERQPDGSWRITGCTLSRAPGSAA